MNNFKLIHKKFLFFIIGLFFIICFSSSASAVNEADKEEIDLSGPETALQDAMDQMFNLIDTIENLLLRSFHSLGHIAFSLLMKFGRLNRA